MQRQNEMGNELTLREGTNKSSRASLKMKRGKKFAKSLRYKFDWKFVNDINRR